MKKVIAILAVMIVLVGAVFAVDSETHNIKIKADVTEVVPVFGMKITVPANNYAGTNAATLKQGSTTEYTTQFGKNDSYGMTTNDTAIDVAFNLDKEGSVTFTAVLLNVAKQNKTYKLTFGGGVFTVSRQGTGNQTYGPDKITTTKGENITGLTITPGADAASGQPAEGATTNKVINLTFDGKTVNDGVDHVLATAVYHYPGDETIDPTATDQFYYANVSLLVETP